MLSDSAMLTGNLVYLILLMTGVGIYLFTWQRKTLGRMARYAALWAMIFLTAIVGVLLWQDIRSDLFPAQATLAGGEIAVPRAGDGHFYLTLEVNGVPTRFVVDTGATDIVLSRRDAERIGLNPDQLLFTGAAATANGRVETAPVRLETVALGPVLDQGVRAVVNGGEMQGSLLGMSYLSRFSRLEIADGRLLLER